MTRQEWFAKQGIGYTHDGNGRITAAYRIAKPSLFARIMALIRR